MSGYPVPLMSEDRGCFCCQPTVPSPIHDQGGVGAARPQHQGQGPVTFSSSSNVTSADSSLAQAQTNFLDLSDLNASLPVPGIHFQSPYFSEEPQFYLPGNNQPDYVIRLGYRMLHNEGDSVFIPSSTSSSNGSGLGASEGSSMNLRVLQNRELGSKPHSNLFNDMKPSSSSRGYNDRLQATPDTRGDAMDLDSALDELGMLSTVTNSRKQYLIETRGQAAMRMREQRLRSKSESSPNLTMLGRPNGIRVVSLDTQFVTSVSDTPPVPVQRLDNMVSESPVKSLPTRLEYRNPDVLEDSARRRRSVPRMSRLRKDRYRHSRCPYKVPNRLCSSMQESDFGPDYFEKSASPFLPSSHVSTSGVQTSNRLTNAPHISQSKSNTASPVKPCQEVKLMRSLSAEDLAPIRRRLEQELGDPERETSRTEQSLDLMTSQMTDLHMS